MAVSDRSYGRSERLRQPYMPQIPKRHDPTHPPNMTYFGTDQDLDEILADRYPRWLDLTSRSPVARLMSTDMLALAGGTSIGGGDHHRVAHAGHNERNRDFKSFTFSPL